MTVPGRVRAEGPRERLTGGHQRAAAAVRGEIIGGIKESAEELGGARRARAQPPGAGAEAAAGHRHQRGVHAERQGGGAAAAPGEVRARQQQPEGRHAGAEGADPGRGRPEGAGGPGGLRFRFLVLLL